MQIELEPEVEAALVAKSATLGITAAEFSAKVLTEHSQLEPNLPMSDVERKGFMDRWVARMKDNNPSLDLP